MIISAVSDLDILGVEPFWEVLKKANEPDVLLFAGDMYDYKSPEVYGLLLDFIKMRKWKCPIVAVFGNHESDSDVKDVKKIVKNKITFLQDESIVLKIKGKKLGIVGSTGCLDTPMWWQFDDFKDADKIYDKRVEKLRKLLDDLKCDEKILLTHFAPTYKTLKGENKRYYSGMGSKKLEKVVKETKPTLAVHGHAHYGTPFAFVGKVPVFNVCLELNNKIVEIDTEKLPRKK